MLLSQLVDQSNFCIFLLTYRSCFSSLSFMTSTSVTTKLSPTSLGSQFLHYTGVRPSRKLDSILERPSLFKRWISRHCSGPSSQSVLKVFSCGSTEWVSHCHGYCICCMCSCCSPVHDYYNVTCILHQWKNLSLGGQNLGKICVLSISYEEYIIICCVYIYSK